MDSELGQICDRLYKANKADIYSFLVRSLRDEATAHDLLQDVFLNFYRIFQKKAMPPDDTERRMYLFKIARNLLINHSQSAYQRRVELRENTEASAMHSQSAEGIVLSQIAHDEAERFLQEALAELSEKERSLLQLRYHAQLKLEDIASIMETSISAVSRRLQRAEKKLRHVCKKRGFVLDES